MNVLKKSLLVFIALLWGAYGTWAMKTDDEMGHVSPHSSPEFKHKEPNEYESNDDDFKSRAVEKRDFANFKAQCDADSKELVMVFGANRYNGNYKNNIYKVDLCGDPDLFMNTDINPLPEKYIGQFDVVVFECITSSETDCKNYERAKAFPNVKNLLKANGLFLVWADNSNSIKDQREALESHGFSFKERIKYHTISLLSEIDENPPQPDRDNIYLEPKANEIKYTIITPGASDVEDSLDFSIDSETLSSKYLSILFSSHLNNIEKQSLENKILEELRKRGHISQFSNYKNYLGGNCISICDILVMEKKDTEGDIENN